LIENGNPTGTEGGVPSHESLKNGYAEAREGVAMEPACVRTTELAGSVQVDAQK